MSDEILRELKIFLKNVKQLTKYIEDYEKLRSNPIENAFRMERQMAAISKSADALPEFGAKNALSTWMDSMGKEIENAKEDFRFQFGQRLKILLEQEGIKMRGQYPLLRFGLFTLKLNFEFGEATLFFGPEVDKIRSKIPLDAETIMVEVRKQYEGIRTPKFDATRMLNDLQTAYRRCLRLANKTSGEKILVGDVLREYVFIKQPKQFVIDARKDNYRAYPRMQLCYMLYQLKKSGIAQNMRLYVATFDATVDKFRSFWIPENEDGEGTYYEYISFGISQAGPHTNKNP
jgi:hypothetical protein